MRSSSVRIYSIFLCVYLSLINLLFIDFHKRRRRKKKVYLLSQISLLNALFAFFLLHYPMIFENKNVDVLAVFYCCCCWWFSILCKYLCESRVSAALNMNWLFFRNRIHIQENANQVEISSLWTLKFPCYCNRRKEKDKLDHILLINRQQKHKKSQQIAFFFFFFFVAQRIEF